MSVRLGELLVSQELLSRDRLHVGLRYQREHGGRLGSILIDLGYVSDDVLATALSQQYDVPSVNLSHFQILPEVIGLIPVEIAIRSQVLPLQKIGPALMVAISDPTNVLALDEITFITGCRVEPVVAADGAIRQAIEEHYGTEQTLELKRVYDALAAEGEYELDLMSDTEVDLRELQKSTSEAPVIKLVNIILADAIRQNASDIHLEPYEQEFRVRYRIDGVLFKIMDPPHQFRDVMVSRIKIMANLDISERRLPQDGRMKIRMNDNGRKKEINFRVSSLPTLFGEKIVLRILHPEKLRVDLSQLGFEPEALERFERAIKRPYGMVLVTGPTGSGKTSTLYSCLAQLNQLGINIMTVEDPVEYNLSGINQVQTKEQIGLTFAAALRSFLRQDPNVIMVGEIRDFETTEIAIRAALTGHLVLSTLHTNDAPSTIHRLLNMGVEPFLIASSIHLICAQRLVRKICNECKELVKTPMTALVDSGFSSSVVQDLVTYRGAGCKMCHQSGYRGRTGVYEVLEVSPGVQKMILTGAATGQVRDLAKKEGMMTLRESGLEKIRAGITTIDEVLRETVVF